MMRGAILVVALVVGLVLSFAGVVVMETVQAYRSSSVVLKARALQEEAAMMAAPFRVVSDAALSTRSATARANPLYKSHRTLPHPRAGNAEDSARPQTAPSPGNVASELTDETIEHVDELLGSAQLDFQQNPLAHSLNTA
jgi:Tfp pilus assembly protein PilX